MVGGLRGVGWWGQHKFGRDEDSNDDGLGMPFSCINVETVKIVQACPLRYRLYCLWTDRQNRSIEPNTHPPHHHHHQFPPPSIQKK